jgi:hypothetical protein
MPGLTDWAALACAMAFMLAAGRIPINDYMIGRLAESGARVYGVRYVVSFAPARPRPDRIHLRNPGLRRVVPCPGHICGDHPGCRQHATAAFARTGRRGCVSPKSFNPFD